MARQRSNTVHPKPARRLVHKASMSTSGDAQLANFNLALTATSSISTPSSDYRESLQSIQSYRPVERYHTPDEMAPFIYISRDCIEALLSELQPTSISLEAFHQVNIIWDELVLQLITHAQSINPSHIRTTGINGVFRAEKNESTGTRALAREAMSDTETEYRFFVQESWGKEGNKAFRSGQGNGMKDDRDIEVRKALNMLRHKIAGALTCNNEPEEPEQDDADMKAFERAGGVTDKMEVSMSSVYLASLSEQVMMPIINQAGEVARRDSGSTTTTASDLYTALSENESVWGFFKRFQCRYALEDTIKPKSKRSVPPRLSGESKTSGRLSALAHNNGSDGSGISLVDANLPIKSSGLLNALPMNNRSPNKRPGTAGTISDKGISSFETPLQQTLRKSPSMSSTRAHGLKDLPERATSALSMNTRGMIGAWNEQAADVDRQTLASSGSIRSKKEQLDEFDALMKSSETMKVSLTPNRLKTFDANGRVKKPSRGIDADLKAETTASPSGSNAKSPGRKLEARDARTIREIEPEDSSQPFAGVNKRKETWMDLMMERSEEVLQSEGSGGEKERLVPPIVLGTAPPRFSPQTPRRKEAMKTNPGLPRFELPDGVEVEKKGAVPGPNGAFATLPRSASVNKHKAPPINVRDMAGPAATASGKDLAALEPVVLGPVSAGMLQARRASNRPIVGSPKKKTPAQEMAEFFDSPPPPGFGESKVPDSFEAPHSASTVRSAPEKEKRKGLRGFMSRIGGSKRSPEEPPSAYSQGISSNDIFPLGTKRMSGGGISNKGGRYGSRSGSTNTALSDAESSFNAQYMDANGRFLAKEYAMAMEAKKKQSLASLNSFAPTMQSMPAPASNSGQAGYGFSNLNSGIGSVGERETSKGETPMSISAAPSPTKLSQTMRYSTPNLRSQQQEQAQQSSVPHSAMPSTSRTPSSTGTTASATVPSRRNSTISRKPVPPVDPRQSQTSTPTLPENAALESPVANGSQPPTAPGSVDSHVSPQPERMQAIKGLGILGAPFEPANAAEAMQGRRKSLPGLQSLSTATSTTEINVIAEDDDERERVEGETSSTASSVTRAKAAIDTEQQLAAARSALAKAKAKARRLSSNGGDDLDDRDVEPTEASPARSPGLLSAEHSPAPFGVGGRTRRDVSPSTSSLCPRTADGLKSRAEGGKIRPQSLQAATALSAISADGSFRTAQEEPTPGEASGQADQVDSVPEVTGDASKGPAGEVVDKSIDSVPEASAKRYAAGSAPALAASPSVPHSALAPLHDLLQHATSVTECRLLISAFLLQLGIKPLGEEDRMDPEQKVIAWLLSGGEGPAGVPAGLVSRAFMPAPEQKGSAGQVFEAQEQHPGLAESASGETELTAETQETADEDSGNMSGMTEDPTEVVTPVSMSNRPSADQAVVV